ncbi:MAG: transporter substrate-binding domain-containing protein [Clostridiales bacterium]|nr:transporter substrate-binding domain-containing protein [Clostridiales bacterium]
MKKMKKLVCMLLAVLTVFALCACGSSSSDKSALQEIKDSGVLTVALSPDFSPMEFVDSSKSGQEQYVGFDVMLAQFIADELGVKLEIQAMSFDACQTAVSTASVPMSISGFSWTEERAENFELSDYYYAGENETEQVLLIRKDDADKYKSAEDFDGVDVGAQNASLQMMMVTEQLPNAKPYTIGDIGVGVLELQSGNIEALAVAAGNAEMIVDSNPDLMVCEWEFDVKTEYEANVVLITKGETELLEAVNAALQKAYDAGYYGEWYEEAVELAKSETAMDLTIEDDASNG